jgi:hypothetical protein
LDDSIMNIGWNQILAVVASGPRENGSEDLQQAALQLSELLRQAGLDPHLLQYMAQPYRLRAVGMFALAGAVLYAVLIWRGRAALALACAIVVPVAVVAELDFYVPIVGWIGAQQQVHVEATLKAPQATQHLIFAAHFDSKTDLLDHVERAPAELLGFPVALVMIIAAVVALWRGAEARRSRLSMVAAMQAVVNGLALFASISAGALVTERSHGALDDGGACAVLVRLAQRLKAAPLARTDVTFLLLSGEEIGVYGSWVYAERAFAHPPERPTAVVNLEFIGATENMGLFDRETFTLRRFEPDPGLVKLLDEVHEQQRGAPLYRFGYPAATDGRSFLAHGVRAATLYNDLPGHVFPRHLHTASDRRERIDLKALDAALKYLQDAAHMVDARGL